MWAELGPAPRGSRAVTNRPLTEEEEATVDVYLHPSPGADESQIISELNNIPVTREKVLCLQPREWLNDEVINFFMELLKARAAAAAELPNCHFFNTLFYATLNGPRGYDYPGVQRWTRRVDLFAQNLLICPIHCHGDHWTLALVNFYDKRLEYFDSLGGGDDGVLAHLRHYLQDESIDKRKVAWDDAGWTDHSWTPRRDGIPQQRNGYDCGVFMCKTADYLSQDARLNFSQDDMDYFRRRLVLEIKRKALLDCGAADEAHARPLERSICLAWRGAAQRTSRAQLAPEIGWRPPASAFRRHRGQQGAARLEEELARFRQHLRDGRQQIADWGAAGDAPL